MNNHLFLWVEMHVRVFRAQREEQTFQTKRVLKIGSNTLQKLAHVRRREVLKNHRFASQSGSKIGPEGLVAPKKQPEAQNRSEKDTQSALRVPHVDVPEVSGKFRGCPGRYEIG